MSLDLDTIVEIWDALSYHISTTDRSEAADTLVSFLIDNNYEALDIKEAFKDKDVIKALKEYVDDLLPDDSDHDGFEQDDDLDGYDD
jgi:hypothetical protein